MISKLKRSECRRNIDAALVALLPGLSFAVFRSKLASLPAISEFSRFSIQDYFAQLEAEGKIGLGQDKKTLVVFDDRFRQQISGLKNFGTERLKELQLADLVATQGD